MTVKLSVAPPSVTLVEPPDWVKVTPETSLSVIETGMDLLLYIRVIDVIGALRFHPLGRFFELGRFYSEELIRVDERFDQSLALFFKSAAVGEGC